MRKRLIALMMALLLIAPGALAEIKTVTFPDGDIGLGLKFFESMDAVKQAVPSFKAGRSNVLEKTCDGMCELLGREAMLAFGAYRENKSEMIVLVMFAPEPAEAPALFEQLSEEVGRIWGEAEEAVYARTEDKAESLTLEDVAGGADAMIERRWERLRYTASVMIEPGEEDGHPRVSAMFSDELGYAGQAAERTRTYAEGTAFFRDTKWGMSMDDVRAAEPDVAFRQNGAYLMGQNSIKMFGDYDVVLTYMFGDGLSSSDAHLSPLGTREQNLAVFQDIRSHLVKAFGEPNADDVFYDEDRYKSQQEAEAANEVSYMTNFLPGDTQIELILYCSPDGYDFCVQYLDNTQMPPH